MGSSDAIYNSRRVARASEWRPKAAASSESPEFSLTGGGGAAGDEASDESGDLEEFATDLLSTIYNRAAGDLGDSPLDRLVL